MEVTVMLGRPGSGIPDEKDVRSASRVTILYKPDGTDIQPTGRQAKQGKARFTLLGFNVTEKGITTPRL
jgi:hypothetical protein